MILYTITYLYIKIYLWRLQWSVSKHFDGVLPSDRDRLVLVKSDLLDCLSYLLVSFVRCVLCWSTHSWTRRISCTYIIRRMSRPLARRGVAPALAWPPSTRRDRPRLNTHRFAPLYLLLFVHIVSPFRLFWHSQDFELSFRTALRVFSHSLNRRSNKLFNPFSDTDTPSQIHYPFWHLQL